MIESDITQIEAELALPLPSDYRKFLLDYPQALIDTKLDLGWMQEAPADRQLYNNPTRLIQLNQDVRAPGTPWVGESGAWPDQYFVIGDDQCGNYWCIDRQGLDPAIWFYDHEVGAFERHHDSLTQFEAYLLVYIAEFNADRPPQSDL
jgi:hypothetical protein